MLNAAQSAAQGNTDTPTVTGQSGPVDSSEQPHNDPLPNPWAPTQPAPAQGMALSEWP